METYDLGDFQLSSGVTLPSAKLAYKTHGTLNATKENAILFPNFLGGAPEALEAWIGEGRPLDPNKYFIVLPGHFGSDPTSSPSNTPPPFDRGAFPPVHIADDVIAQHRLMTERFGVEELHLVLGWSVGALQIYQWAVRFPSVVKRLACLAGAPRPSTWTQLWFRTVIEGPITSDPAWQNGFYTDARSLQAAARQQGRGTALTVVPPGFYRRETWRSLGFASADDFVSRFWEAYWLPLDPNDILAQARKGRTADPSAGGDVGEALRRITAKTLIVAFRGDPMFPPEEGRLDAEAIPGAEFREIGSDFGHLATFALSEHDRKAIDGALAEALAM